LDLDLDWLPNLKQVTNDELLELDDARKTLGLEAPESVELVELKLLSRANYRRLAKAGQTAEVAAGNMGISLKAVNRCGKFGQNPALAISALRPAGVIPDRHLHPPEALDRLIELYTALDKPEEVLKRCIPKGVRPSPTRPKNLLKVDSPPNGQTPFCDRL